MAPAAGHNSGEQLRSIIERIEKLEEEKAATATDIRDVYTEAASAGFDKKALRTIIKMRKQDADERAEHEAIVEIYMRSLGMSARSAQLHALIGNP